MMTKIRPQRMVCSFSFVEGKGPLLDTLDVLSDVSTCKMEFSWSWAARTTLRDDLIELLTSLMQQCFPDAAAMDQFVQTDNFLAQLPGLRFENLNAERGSDGSGQLTLHMTVGDVPGLMHKPEDKKIGTPLEDVFLPLNNLSSYLRAMTDQTGNPACSRAVDATADRIDEFLLIYGARLQDTLSGPERSNLN